jgi:hypothetical protein
MNKGPYKLILNKEFSQKDLDYFTAPPPNTDLLELFNILSDPQEKSNIAQKNPNITTAILQKIKEVYSQPQKRNTGKTEIDEKLKEQLKALGYIH